ncbi:hypothetical protein QA612_02155 [Evansella sp. AB-P1]|uniref:hypothetical protein n=1 Tax=Evansella sp. AB-P1 TaxID=3037653 RepID=UPI00241CE971|nr:hypothetical protein [Evansella sp. AB-P1]MDG5786276.1 hypothetical protein [Evansella sp. AB-P1]
MNKLLILFFLSIVFLGGCQAPDEEEFDFSGRSLGLNYELNMLTIFIEDNVYGDEFQYYTHDDFSIEEYEVEAYRAFITEETKFILEETGEELKLPSREEIYMGVTYFDEHLLSLFQGTGRQVDVKVEEDFSPKKLTNRSDYIVFDHHFIPIYTAKEIVLSSLNFEDFLSQFFLNSRNGQNDYFVTIITEPGSDEEREFHAYYNRYAQDLQLPYHSPNIYHHMIDSLYFESFHPPEEYRYYPIILVVHDSEVIHHSDNWDETVEFIDDIVDDSSDENF